MKSWDNRRDPVTMLRLHIGRRGVVLATIGAVWTVVAYAVATARPTAESRGSGRFELPFFDAPWWSLLWAIGGVGAIAVAILRARGHDDVLGWLAAVIPPILWCVFYLWSWLWWVATEGTDGTARGWSGAVVYALVAGLIRTVAGWEDALDAEPRRPSIGPEVND